MSTIIRRVAHASQSNRPLRVVVWSTGGIGSISIVAVARRPDLELAGVWVHSDEKVGRDAGELANGHALGCVATNDADALLELEPDCVVYAANGPARDVGAVPDYERMLRAGINVVTTTSSRMIYPPAYDPALAARIDAAAKAGGASIYASGIEPGFACDYFPLVLATQSSAIRTLRASEIALYDDYPVADVMMDGMGFGRPMDFEPLVALPGVITHEWGGGVRMIADTLGFELDEIRERVERSPSPRDLEVACGTIPAGTSGAIRIEAIGVVEGKEVIVIEHINRMARDVAPDWPIGERDHEYRIEIEGTPNIHCELSHSVADPEAAGAGGMAGGAGGMVATAMRVVNAIPFVVAADPGLVHALDLPLTVPTHALDDDCVEASTRSTLTP